MQKVMGLQVQSFLKRGDVHKYINRHPCGSVISVIYATVSKYCGHSALMNKQKRGWQETDYVLSVFGNSPATARRSYNAYVKAGSGQGRRPELTGGGLIRSLGVTQPAVSYAVSRGERIARKKNYSLVL